MIKNEEAIIASTAKMSEEKCHSRLRTIADKRKKLEQQMQRLALSPNAKTLEKFQAIYDKSATLSFERGAIVFQLEHLHGKHTVT